MRGDQCVGQLRPVMWANPSPTYADPLLALWGHGSYRAKIEELRRQAAVRRQLVGD